MHYPERPLDPPEIPHFNGHISFPAQLGAATVRVECEVEEGELIQDGACVMYQGVDITPILFQSHWDLLQQEFDTNPHYTWLYAE